MAVKKFSWQGILIRFVVALILVFATYNPHGYSYFDWLEEYFNPAKDANTPLALVVFAGIVLLIIWTMFIRATLRSLGMFEIVSLSNFPLIIDLALVIFSGVLATGMSWSHIRRRISGQYDVDDIDN